MPVATPKKISNAARLMKLVNLANMTVQERQSIKRKLLHPHVANTTDARNAIAQIEQSAGYHENNSAEYVALKGQIFEGYVVHAGTKLPHFRLAYRASHPPPIGEKFNRP